MATFRIAHFSWLLVGLLTLLAGPVSADLVIIVNPANPVQSLTEREVKKLFMGRIRMFPETELESQVVDLPDENPQFEALYGGLINITAVKLRRYRASYLFSGKGNVPVEQNSMEAVLQYVAENPSAIGYVELEAMDSRVKPVFVLSGPAAN